MNEKKDVYYGRYLHVIQEQFFINRVLDARSINLLWNFALFKLTNAYVSFAVS